APEEVVLGALRWYYAFPGPENRQDLPLRELWEGWWASRPAKTRDADGFEVLRVMNLPLDEVREGEEDADDWDEDDDTPRKDDPAVGAARRQIVPAEPIKVRYEVVIRELLNWFSRLYPPPAAADFVLDAAETALALVPPSLIDRLPRTEQDEIEQEDDD